MDSNLLHKESDEAQRQLDREEGGGTVSSEEESADEEGEEEAEKGEDTGGTETSKQSKKSSTIGEKRLRNQFNFSERASQTLSNPFRVSCKVCCEHAVL